MAKYYSFEEAGFYGVNYFTSGKQHTTCPKCSASRKKSSDKCADITAVNGGWVWHCNHCGAGKGDFISSDPRPDEQYNQYQPAKKRDLRALNSNTHANTHAKINNGQNGQINAFGGQYAHMQQAQPVKREYKRPNRHPLNSLYSKEFLAFFASRSISEPTLRKMGIVETKHWIPAKQGEVLCAAFAISYNLELMAYKYRAIASKDFAISKDAELVLYNADVFNTARALKKRIKSLILVEGEIDLLSFIEAGYTDVVSVPNGAKNLGFLDKHFASGDFDIVDNFILATDNDSEGIKLRDEFARRVGKERCRIMQYPQRVDGSGEMKDPNEVLQALGAKALQQVVLQDYPISGVRLVEDVIDDLQVLREEGFKPAAKTGLVDLDGLFSWALGAQLTALSAPPNSAKSDFIFNVAMRLAILHDAKIGIMSPETGDAAEIYQALCAIYMGKLFSKRPVGLPNGSAVEIATDDELLQALEFVRSHFFVYACDELSINTERFLEIGKSLVARYGVQMLICDPYNYISDSFAPEQGAGDVMMSNYLNANLQKIKFWATTTDVHVVLVPHPKQMQPFERMVDYGQVNGGAAWANKVDNFIFLNRLFPDGRYTDNIAALAQKTQIDSFNPDLGDYIECIVRKVKKRYMGRYGSCRLAYHIPTGRVGNVVEDGAAELRMPHEAVKYEQINDDTLPDFRDFGSGANVYSDAEF